MSDNTIFEKFASLPENDNDIPLYRAFELGKQGRSEKRLMLMFHDGQISIMAYSYLMEALCTSHQYLSLIFTNCVITMKGRELNGLLTLIQDEKIRLLQCYHPKVHRLPAEAEPMIMSMKREHPHEVLRHGNA